MYVTITSIQLWTITIICFTFEAWCQNFCCLDKFFTFWTSLWDFQFRFEVMHPGFSDSDYSLQKCISFLFVMSQMFLAQFWTMLFLCGKTACVVPTTPQLFFFIAYSFKILCIIVSSICDISSISHTIIRLLSNSVDMIAAEELSIVVGDDQSTHHLSLIFSLPEIIWTIKPLCYSSLHRGCMLRIN